ncbi:MAG: signal peptidase I [Oscillospiraceae bacterium]|nr:signal peptidase I [Oscillospiraceae bacterium]
MKSKQQLEEQEADFDEEELEATPLQRRISFVVTVLLVLAVALCVYVVVQVLSNGYANLGGFMMFRVVTGSMEPEIPVGSLLITQEVDISTIQLRDIICFRSQDTQIWGRIVTHRVVGILEAPGGGILLETQGDANVVMDGYLVTRDNLVGKVIWHTGDGSVLADIFSFFTNQVGFLGLIVFPCLLLAGLILRECVNNIRTEMQEALELLEQPEQEISAWDPNDPLCGLTPEEYEQIYREIYMEMYERIRAELIEELKNSGKIPETTK